MRKKKGDYRTLAGFLDCSLSPFIMTLAGGGWRFSGASIMDVNSCVVVCGGGGFIGGHLVGDLIRKGFKHVRCVDIKPTNEWYQVHGQAENVVADLNIRDRAFEAVKGMDHVINLACNMGGMGFIENNKGLCMVSVLINTHLLLAARELGGVKKFFYASSACVYNADKQKDKK